MNDINEPFTRVPNAVLRSKMLDPAEKIILSLILSCNPSFPSYTSLEKWAGVRREKVWKALKKLSYYKLIHKTRKGRQVYYSTPWSNGSINEPISDSSVRYTDPIGSITEPVSVRLPNSKKNNKKEQEKALFCIQEQSDNTIPTVSRQRLTKGSA